MAEYFLTYDGTLGRGNWATYAYVDNANASTNQQFINLKYYTDSSLYKRDLSINDLYGLINSEFTGKPYIDGSLYLRDVSIAYLNSQIGIGYTNLKDYTDGSLYLRDVSINYLNGQIGIGYSNLKDYTDGSLYLRDVSIAYLNNQIGSGLITYINGSLNARDVSISWLNANKIELSALDPYATNASVGLALNNYVKNASLSAYKYIKESSLGPAFHWNASTSGSLLDVNPLTTLYDLTDVSIQFTVMGSRDGRVLTYDESDFLWRDTALYNNPDFKLINLRDTSIISLVDTQVIQYESSTAKWKNITPIDICTLYYDINAIDQKVATINVDISTLQYNDYYDNITWYIIQTKTEIPAPLIGRTIAYTNHNFFTYGDISIWVNDPNHVFDGITNFKYLTIPYRESVFLRGYSAAPYPYWVTF
jgi:hypothetical protein